MVDRFTIYAIDDLYGASLKVTSDSDGEWVRYEDAISAHFIAEAYEELTEKISKRWQQIVGFGYGYFESWRISGDKIYVSYTDPSRSGSRPGTDELELSKFDGIF